MKRIKKIISLLLTLCLIMGMSTTAFASEIQKSAILSNGIEFLTIYDEANGTVQAVQRNITTGESVYGPLISINAETKTPYNSEVLARATKIHQDTFLNFEYDIWQTSPREWNLERPNGVFKQYYFKVFENASNKSELRTWKSDVDKLNAQEWAVIGGAGLTIFNTVKACIISHAAIASGGILTTAAIDSIKDAIVAAGGTTIGVGLLCTTYNNCAMSYNDVFEATNNKHY